MIQVGGLLRLAESGRIELAQAGELDRVAISRDITDAVGRRVEKLTPVSLTHPFAPEWVVNPSSSRFGPPVTGNGGLWQEFFGSLSQKRIGTHSLGEYLESSLSHPFYVPADVSVRPEESDAELEFRALLKGSISRTLGESLEHQHYSSLCALDESSLTRLHRFAWESVTFDQARAIWKEPMYWLILSYLGQAVLGPRNDAELLQLQPLVNSFPHFRVNRHIRVGFLTDSLLGLRFKT